LAFSALQLKRDPLGDCESQTVTRRSMKAAFIDRYGSNDRVSVADIAVPPMSPPDLLVQVHAASVNPLEAEALAARWRCVISGSLVAVA